MSTTAVPQSKIYSPTLLFVFISIIVVYYVVFASLGAQSGSGMAYEYRIYLEYTVWILFIVLLLLDGMAYIFKIDVIEQIKELFSLSPSITTDVEKRQLTPMQTDTLAKVNFNLNTPQDADAKAGGFLGGSQVFHISDNTYNYKNARAVCNAYDARLATFKEVDDAYQAGGEWCSYGWSEGQMALYPTQYGTWNKLQKIEAHKNDCGRPGINGGYIENENLKFGVNCYGSKPGITPEAAYIMQNRALFQKNAKEIEFDNTVAHWRSKLPNILVDPFNRDSWSAV
jgi:hypothetical protein